MRKLLLVCVVFGVQAAPAETDITNVLVSQRWPWSEKVDVDFVLSGEKTDIDVYATWDALRTGGESAVSNRVLLSSLFGVSPGANRFTWDPSVSPFAGQTLTGFTVALEPVTPESHTYLVIDLKNGGIGYRTEPDGEKGRWTEDYRTSKMVFRRIPAGSYAIGEPESTLTYLGVSATDAATYAKIWARHTVTFTHDFYVGVFRYTTAQQSWLEKARAGGDACSARLSYETLRGKTNAVATLNIDWPLTRYKVAPDSVVARLRSKAGGALMVDLCEDEQWEVALRANTTTFWPSGGTTEESYATLSNHVSRIASWRGNGYKGLTAVGQQEPNAWGLYDIIGAGSAEWVLDSCAYANNKRTLPTGTQRGSTDPVGGHGTGLRLYRGFGAIGATIPFYNLLPCQRRTVEPSDNGIGVRFCIHLEDLNFGD